MDEVKQIVNDIKNGNSKPIYFLMGEEPYYIDKITEYIEKTVLTEEERGFNQMVMYGKEVSIDDIVSNAKRYPMMSEKQVVIVKEAQHLSRTIDNLAAYAENPQPTTILVLCYKYGKLDKRKKVYKAIKKTGVLFESKKLYEDRVADWIRTVMQGKGYKIHPMASQMLVEYLGSDLSKINNELEKLQIVVSKDTEITPSQIEEHIGISKDFNNFALTEAIGQLNIVKANRIVNYFGQNPKDNPLVVTVALVHRFFTQLLQYHGLSDHSKSNVAKNLGINPFFVNQFQTAARNFPMKKVSKIISSLRDLDLKGKGVGGANIAHEDLLKELLIKVF